MTDITELAQRMKAAAEKASNGEWVKESGDGWEASCSANDQANGGFIIAHFEGPDAAENREFVQTANPANILALVEALEKRSSKRLKAKTAFASRIAISVSCSTITQHCASASLNWKKATLRSSSLATITNAFQRKA